jgi:hypothetical protein
MTAEHPNRQRGGWERIDRSKPYTTLAGFPCMTGRRATSGWGAGKVSWG